MPLLKSNSGFVEAEPLHFSLVNTSHASGQLLKNALRRCAFNSLLMECWQYGMAEYRLVQLSRGIALDQVVVVSPAIVGTKGMLGAGLHHVGPSRYRHRRASRKAGRDADARNFGQERPDVFQPVLQRRAFERQARHLLFDRAQRHFAPGLEQAAHTGFGPGHGHGGRAKADDTCRH
jgi:hypothetical protein